MQARRGAILFGIAFLLSCQPDPAAGKIPLRYMAWGNPEQMALEEQFCAEFNRQNPDIHVRFFRVPGSAYLNKAIVMFASRTAPDVVRIDHYNFPDLVRKGYFLNLSPLAARDKGFSANDFFPQAIREGTYGGRLYGLNVMFGGEIMYYNKSMVREAGLEDPYELAKRGEWTYDRFRQHAIRMTQRDAQGRPLRFGCQIPSFPMTAPVIWAFGGDILAPDRKSSRFADPGTIRAMQFLADLRWKDRCSPTPAQAANAAFTFESGKLGMIFDWMGMAPRFNKAIKDFEWDICPIPTGPKGNVTMTKGNQLVASADTKYPEAAWRFIRYMTGPEVEQKLYVENRRNFPTRKAVAYSREFREAKVRPFHTDVFLRAVENARELPIDHRWGEWTTAFNPEQDNLFSGRVPDAKVAMTAAQRAVDRVLADEEGF